MCSSSCQGKSGVISPMYTPIYKHWWLKKSWAWNSSFFMTQFAERFVYGELYKKIKRLQLSHQVICYVIVSSYLNLMQRQKEGKQDTAPFVKIHHGSFGKKAEETSQHLNNLLVWECLPELWQQKRMKLQSNWPASASSGVRFTAHTQIWPFCFARKLISWVDEISQGCDLVMLYILQYPAYRCAGFRHHPQRRIAQYCEKYILR